MMIPHLIRHGRQCGPGSADDWMNALTREPFCPGQLRVLGSREGESLGDFRAIPMKGGPQTLTISFFGLRLPNQD